MELHEKVNNYEPKLNLMMVYILTTFAGIFFMFGYIQAELNTRLHLDRIEQASVFCEKEEQQLLSMKLVEYNRNKGDARIYCLYKNEIENRELRLSEVNGNWVISQDRLINSDGRLVWPMY